MNSDIDLTENDAEEFVPESIKQVARNVSLDLLPRVSKQLYTSAYNSFKKWRRDNGCNSFCEDVMLAYFFHLSEKYVPSSLWSIYSMLKSTIKAYNQIDISQYQKLISYLKKQSVGYKPKKSLVFTDEEISRFLNEAPDDLYLCMKVVLIFGITGAVRREEFTKILVKDVLDKEDLLFVKINETKNNVPRSFTIIGDFYHICKRYMQLRPQLCPIDRFFLKYTNGKCKCQPIGINKFGSAPREVAEYLQLPDADRYTGHSFRRTSATLLVNAGGDITTLKRHGGWKSNTVAEGYIADSVNNKKKICQQISSGITVNKPATVTSKDFEPTSPSGIDRDQLYVQNKTITKTKSTPTSAVTRVSDHQDRREESNTNVTIVGYSDLKSVSSSFVETQNEQKGSIFYDPDMGLYLMCNNFSNKSFVFYNCNISA